MISKHKDRPRSWSGIGGGAPTTPSGSRFDAGLGSAPKAPAPEGRRTINLSGKLFLASVHSFDLNSLPVGRLRHTMIDAAAVRELLDIAKCNSNIASISSADAEQAERLETPVPGPGDAILLFQKAADNQPGADDFVVPIAAEGDRYHLFEVL